jgi:YD repeat-containing protein
MKFLQALTLLLCISPFSGPHAQDYGDKDAPECRHVECVVVESRGRGILIPSDDRLRREFEARLEAERRNPYGPRPAPPSANYYGTAPPPDPYAQPYSPPTRPVYGPPNPKVQPVHPKATSASEAITQYGHDALGRNTLIDDSEYGATVIDYWPDGRIRSIERSGGVVSEYTYDLAGRTETITHTRGAEVIARVAYDYDANGNRIEERLSQGGAERITTYEYDRDDRLIAVNTPDGRDEYTLDPVGNRIGEKSWAGDELINDITQDFDARDRIQSRTDAISGLSTSYQHDANGNLTAETVSGPGIATRPPQPTSTIPKTACSKCANPAATCNTPSMPKASASPAAPAAAPAMMPAASTPNSTVPTR